MLFPVALILPAHHQEKCVTEAMFPQVFTCSSSALHLNAIVLQHITAEGIDGYNTTVIFYKKQTNKQTNSHLP